MHEYFDVLGPNRICALEYRENDVDDAYKTAQMKGSIIGECQQAFTRGQHYRLSEVKSILQDIFDKLGISTTAKANDIENYLPVEKRQLTSAGSGKRELYYLIV